MINVVLNAARRYRRALVAVAAVVGLYAIAGFVFLPWLLERVATDTVRERYGASLAVDRIALNPFALSLRVDGLDIDDPAGEPLLDLSQVYVNFQLSSLFRRAWTFDEFRLDGPHANLVRASDGRLNLAFLQGTEETPAVAEDPADQAAIPRLIVFDFAVNDAVVDWRDEAVPEPVATRFGPVNATVRELNTLPQRAGEQAVVIETESGGSVGWGGSLALNPLRSSGGARIQGSHFSLVSAYVRQQAGLDIVRGDIALEVEYAIDSRDDGALAVAVDNLHVILTDVHVRTLADVPAGDGYPGPELLRVPVMELRGGRFRWPDRRVEIESIDVNDAVASLYRSVGGELVLLPETAAAETAETAEAAAPPAASAAAPAEPWSISLGRFSINRASAGIVDDTVAPAAELAVDDLGLVLTDIDNGQGTEFPTSLSFRTRAGGSVTARGTVSVVPEPVADFELEVEAVPLAPLQPYVRQVATVRLDSGALNASANLHHGPDNPLRLDGDTAVTDLQVSAPESESAIGRWSLFELEGLQLDLAARSLDVTRARVVEPYADIVIAEDGSVNLGRLLKDDATTANAEDGGAEAGTAPEEGEPPFAVAIGGVEVADGSAHFADLSLPLPFDAQIVGLDGSVSTIATASREPAEIGLEGQVDEYGLVRVSGTITPLNPSRNTAVDVIFRNVAMPKMSAYTIPFAGREIADGRMDLDLRYTLDEGRMVGENNIVLREFELGERVPHPDALSLPLGLAVALLKDASGNIDVDLSVSGDVNDPEFSYGGVIAKSLVNLIVRIAASPFALLGNLLGVDAEELEYIRFDYGRADLAPPQRESVAQLAEALALRPELILDIPPVVDPDDDAEALRAATLESVVEARLAGSGDAAEPVTERRRQVLEELYRDAVGDADSQADLDSLQAEFARAAGESDEAEPVFDTVAYTAALRRRLVARQPLEDGALRALADRRAARVRDAIVAIDPALAERLVVVELDEVSGEDGAVRMHVALSASAD